jgi:hypothetical protein
MARKVIRSSAVLAALLVAAGLAGCSCHKSSCYDGDCGLVYDNDYWETVGGGSIGSSGHHDHGCGGCGGPIGHPAHAGCAHPHSYSTGCSGPHHHSAPTCATCGGVHTQPAPVSQQPGCPHCGQIHGPASEGAPAAEPAPPAGTTASPPPPPLPPSIPATPADKPAGEKPEVDKPATSQVPLPLQTLPASSSGALEPAPPLNPVQTPLPVLENPAPIPRDAAQPKWIPRRL